jgi:hypothetical protein
MGSLRSAWRVISAGTIWVIRGGIAFVEAIAELIAETENSSAIVTARTDDTKDLIPEAH